MIIVIILLSIIAFNSFLELYEKFIKIKRYYHKKYRIEEEDISFDNPDIDRSFWFD